VGQNVRIVQFGGGQESGQNNALASVLRDIPELATVINAKTEALSGQNIEQVLARIAKLFKEQPRNDAKPEPSE
jgi:hypothetical protein